jgi:signal peptidase I
MECKSRQCILYTHLFTCGCSIRISFFLQFIVVRTDSMSNSFQCTGNLIHFQGMTYVVRVETKSFIYLYAMHQVATVGAQDKGIPIEFFSSPRLRLQLSLTIVCV